jgi:hypothetical protein
LLALASAALAGAARRGATARVLWALKRWAAPLSALACDPGDAAAAAAHRDPVMPRAALWAVEAAPRATPVSIAVCRRGVRRRSA